MDEELLYAYLAGAIEGNGYITIGKQIRTVGEKYKHHPTYYHAYIGFNDAVNSEIQEILQKHFGGSIWKQKPKNENQRTNIIWKAEGKIAENAIRAIYPYLIIKKEQATLTLQFLEMVEAQKKEIHLTQKPPYHIAPTMEDERKKLWEAVTRLNQPRNRRVHFIVETTGGVG